MDKGRGFHGELPKETVEKKISKDSLLPVTISHILDSRIFFSLVFVQMDRRRPLVQGDRQDAAREGRAAALLQAPQLRVVHAATEHVRVD